MATKKIEKGTILNKVDNLKATVGKLQNEVVEVSDNLVDVSLATGDKWQKVMAKALNGGTVLFGKQQELVLNTLEELKGQYVTGNKKFKKLFGLELPKKQKTTKTVKEIDAEMEKAVKVATKTAKAVTKTKKAATKTVKVAASAKSDIATDDLKTIDGIGPKMEALLNKAGMTTFNKLANANSKELKTILQAAGPRFKSFDPTKWIEQAKLAASRKLAKKTK